MKTVLLAGGLGTRLREETEFRPKPMVQVGNRPILWHIMRAYSHFGHNDFVVCAGYKGEFIKEYFREFQSEVSDFTVTLGQKHSIEFHDKYVEEGWKVTVADTGQSTMTGGRLFKSRKYINDETFMCTYGDGLADVNINKLLDFHKSHGKIATITAIKPVSRFGVLDLSPTGTVPRETSGRWLG
jgi:glucose-1-phosphate cytidylyltransferase